LKIILSEEVFQRCRKIASGICKQKNLMEQKKAKIYLLCSEFKLLKQDNEYIELSIEEKEA
jgi:hypothetical protein